MSSTLNKNRLYLLLFIACSIGCLWIYYNYAYNTDIHTGGINTCIIKKVTGVPCPSCGTTRSIIEILSGNIIAALYSNPLGFLVLTIITFTPLWIIFDYLFKKDSLYIIYLGTERFFRNKFIAIIAITLVIANWIWNIQKGL